MLNCFKPNRLGYLMQVILYENILFQIKFQAQPIGIPYAGNTRGYHNEQWFQAQPIGIPYAGH